MAVSPIPRSEIDRLVPVFLTALRGLGFADAESLLPSTEWLRVPRGEVVFHEGNRGDSLYLVLNGRFRVVVRDDEDGSEVIRTLGAGEVFGELSLLTGEPRAATIQAARDSEVACLGGVEAAGRLIRDTGFLLPLARLVADRLRTATRWRPPPSTTIALIAVNPSRLAIEAMVTPMRDVANPDDTVRLLSSGDVPESLRAQLGDGADTSALAAWLSEQETLHDFLLLAIDPTEIGWTRQCLRHADRLVFIALAGDAPTLDALSRVTATLDEERLRPEQSLVLFHPEGTTLPSGTRHWLALREFASVHHCRLGNRADLARLARFYSGRAVGLVLGGGGARAFAHIGVIRALLEAGIPIDMIGGTSIGSVMAAQYAQGWSPERMLEVNRAEWNRVRIDRAFTLPLVSLWSVNSARRMLHRMFDDTDLEDLWLDCYCATTNLTTCQLHSARRGPVELWTRASSSVPALWPPVVSDTGELMVDGGVLDNLPVRAMAERGAGPIIAVNVSPFVEMRVPPGTTEPSSGLHYLTGGLIGRKHRVPHIINLVYRTGGIGGLQTRQIAKHYADLLLEPPVGHYAVNAYSAIDEIVDAAYRYSSSRIADAKTRLVPEPRA